MSRFLNVNNYSLSVMVVGSVVSLIAGFALSGIFFFGVVAMAVYGLILVGNRKVYGRIMAQCAPFAPDGAIRNADCLIVGDLCDGAAIAGGESTYVQISAPQRGMAGCREIIRHTHSILREGGTVCVCLNHRYIRRPIHIFDVPFFHTVTIRALHLESEKRWSPFPLLRSPWLSLLLLSGKTSKGYALSAYHDDELDDFCRERGYTVQYWMK